MIGETEQMTKGKIYRKDLATLMKVRLNAFVLVTTLFGYLLATRNHEWSWIILFHTLLGTAATAFGSAAFNQLMEIDLDATMKRTADRPLPSKRMDAVNAFAIGLILSVFGIVHLANKVGAMPAILTAITLITYVLIYTPMKRWSSVNTLVGAIPGAIPPMIGWTAGGGALDSGAWFLFALLFLWQLPHFIAINWMCREEYETAGYKMWSNGDVSGKNSANLAAMFSLCLSLIALWPWLEHRTHIAWVIGGVLLGLVMTWLSFMFKRNGDRQSARRLFLFTLIYLPASLTLLTIFWLHKPI
jgi:heme o synthase